MSEQAATNGYATKPKSTRLQLLKPGKDTLFASASAKLLMKIVSANGWEVSIGAGKHLKYEAWQTVGKFYNCTVRTYDAKFVTYGNVEGFEAKAEVIDNNTGLVIGGAESACMRDEEKWEKKSVFQLKSMAQTRAGSKALRQMFGYVVALAGYNPTPAEEMEQPRSNTAENRALTTNGGKNAMKATDGEVVREKVDQTPSPNGFARCSVESCNKVLTSAVEEYSLREYKKPLCMDHQKEDSWIEDDSYLK